MTLSNEYRSYTNTSADEESRLVELINDALLIAPSITTALLHSKSQTKSTFVYNYAVLEPMELAGDYLKRSAASATKSTVKSKEITNSTTIFEELSMVFGQPLVPSMRLIQRAGKRNYSNLEVKLSEKLIHYWTLFAKSGDPNAQMMSSTPYHHTAYHHSGQPASGNAKDALSNHLASNYSQNDVISAQQPKVTTQAGRTEHWPTFNEHTQLHLNLNLHPTVTDHMRSHPLSFFLNLLPKLNRPVANNMQMNEHHLLEDHHNLATYEGVVREHPAAGLMRNIALDLEDQLASKRMLELLLNGERQLSEQSNDEKSKLGSLMKLREKLLKWKFISEQSNMETQQNYDDLIRKLTSRIEGGSGGGLARGNSTIVIEMDSNQENGPESASNPTSSNQHPNQLGQETPDQSGNQDDEQEENSIQQNLKQINTPPNTQHPKLSNEQLNYHHNANESFSMIIQDGNYSTALSVTIIVGCSLLFLNILVFAGVFLNRDSRRRRNGNGSLDQQTPNGNAIGGNNEHHLLNNALLANGAQLTGGTTASLNGQQLKAYQANSSFYLPCCEYDTGGHQQQQQQCNATILTLKRNSSNKTYIAKTSTCGQLKQHSIESDYYLQQQQQNYLDNCLDGCLDDHRTMNGHLTSHNNHGPTINNKISANNELPAAFDLANEAALLDKPNGGESMAKAKLQQQIDCLTIDGSSGLGSSLDNTLSQTLSNSVNSGNTITNLINGSLMGNQLNGKLPMGDHLLHHQQLGVDMVNVSCSSAISSSSAATMITSSPANTLTSTPDYYSNGLHQAGLLGNQSLSQSNCNGALASSNYLSQTRDFQNDHQIQGLYGHHQGNHYSVQLSGLSPALGDTMTTTLDSLDAQQSKLMNSNHCNIINCSISQCDCDPASNGLFKEDYHHRMQSNS